MSANRFKNVWQRVKGELYNFSIVFGGVYVFNSTICGFTICVGPSMIPTIDPRGELAFIDKLSYKLAIKEYKVNDVVISMSMDDPKKTVCKRIRGVEGDVVFYRNKAGAPVIVTIPKGHVWLLGDNPSNSNDSRYYGPVPLGMVLGRVFGKISFNPSFHISHIDTIHEMEDQKSKNKEVAKKENVEKKEAIEPVQTETATETVVEAHVAVAEQAEQAKENVSKESAN